MHIRKNISIILIILAALLLIVSVVIVSNKRIREIETKQQPSQSENIQTSPLFTI